MVKMKQTTIDRIIKNHDAGKVTHIGNYTYDIQFHPMVGKCFVVRCPKGKEEVEFLNPEGIVVNYWEWIEKI